MVVLTVSWCGITLLRLCHYMIQPLVELYGGCMVALKVSWGNIMLKVSLTLLFVTFSTTPSSPGPRGPSPSRGPLRH
jgi:hypothetical protein